MAEEKILNIDSLKSVVKRIEDKVRTTLLTKSNIVSILGIKDWALGAKKPSYTKSEVGLGQVQNTAFYERNCLVNGVLYKISGTANADTFTIYAPTTAGNTKGMVLVSSDQNFDDKSPVWAMQSALVVGRSSDADNADKLSNKSIYELFESLNANDGITIVIGGVTKSVTKAQLKTLVGLSEKGSHSLPVYYEDGVLKEIDSLSVEGDVSSQSNISGQSVSANGISDLYVEPEVQSTKVTISNTNMSDGSTAGAGITAYKKGNQVTLQGSFLFNRSTSTAVVTVCTIPQAYRPSHDINVIQLTTTEVMWRARVAASDGRLTLRGTFTPSTGEVTDSSERTYCISITYYI